jgi:hypothetical protein
MLGCVSLFSVFLHLQEVECKGASTNMLAHRDRRADTQILNHQGTPWDPHAKFHMLVLVPDQSNPTFLFQNKNDIIGAYGALYYGARGGLRRPR